MFTYTKGYILHKKPLDRDNNPTLLYKKQLVIYTVMALFENSNA